MFVRIRKNADKCNRLRTIGKKRATCAKMHLRTLARRGNREVKVGDDRNGAAVLFWTRACRIGDYLSNVIRDRDSRPPESAGVYVVSKCPWEGMPSKSSGVVYVGQARYLRSRIGALFCDLLGFTGDEYSDGEAYEHGGGHFLWYHYCIAHAVEPSNLYVGWCSPCRCLDCAEAKLRDLMDIRWNWYPTRSCEHHIPALELSHNCSTSVLPFAGSRRQHDTGKN